MQSQGYLSPPPGHKQAVQQFSSYNSDSSYFWTLMSSEEQVLQQQNKTIQPIKLDISSQTISMLPSQPSHSQAINDPYLSQILNVLQADNQSKEEQQSVQQSKQKANYLQIGKNKRGQGQKKKQKQLSEIMETNSENMS